MGLFDSLRKALGGKAADGPFSGPADRPGMDTAELARRLGMSEAELQAVPVGYDRFRIPKRSGGNRTIDAPIAPLKAVQRRILRRLLARLKAHPVATGFERGHSIVSNAAFHHGRAVVVRMDVKDFFASTTAGRIRRYFRGIGWDADAAELLTKLCTHDGRLPQGAPTSPRLSNLVNYPLDARLEGLAGSLGARFTRYADDMTFSFAADDPSAARKAIRATKRILADCGYRLHQKQKLHVRRRSHQRQLVTGLVVNDGVNLPREVRRRVRAVRHRIATGRQATLTPAQLAGWEALLHMVATQSPAGE